MVRMRMTNCAHGSGHSPLTAQAVTMPKNTRKYILGQYFWYFFRHGHGTGSYMGMVLYGHSPLMAQAMNLNRNALQAST